MRDPIQGSLPDRALDILLQRLPTPDRQDATEALQIFWWGDASLSASSSGFVFRDPAHNSYVTSGWSLPLPEAVVSRIRASLGG